jgi:glutamate/tyrosine decarboxylase-like PLP-dependent enzyme
LVIDPHKGLFLPYGTGAVLIKNREAVMHSQHYTASYMQDARNEEAMINPADVSPELTKHFRGLRMWLPLMLYGDKPFAACLEEKLHLTTYFRARLHEIGFKLGPEPDLSVSYFWWELGDQSNAYNSLLMKKIHADGRVFLSSTNLKGQVVIRMAILAFRTHKSTIDRAMEMIVKAKKECDLEWQLASS